MSGESLSSTDRRDTRALPLIEVGLVALACAITSLLYASYFTDLSYLAPLLTAVVAGAVLAGVAALRRWRLSLTLLSAVLGFMVFAAFGVFRSTLNVGVPTGDTAVKLGSGLVRGWARMLSVSLPAEVTGELLVIPALITWSAVFVATTLGLRTRTVLLPLLPPVVSMVVGLLFTANRADPALPGTAVFLVAVLALMLVRSIRLDGHHLGVADQTHQAQNPVVRGQLRLMTGQAVFGLPIVLVAALIGTAGAGLVPVATGKQRFDLRDVVPQPLQLRDALTPLATLKNQLRDPARELFTDRIDSNDTGAGIDRVRTAILDDFDGAVWTSEDRFLVAGRALPLDPSLTDARRVTLHISITRLDGPYLPALGWPVHVDQPGFGFSSASGALVTNDALSDLNYDVVGELRPRDDHAMRDAVPNLTPGSDRYTQLPANVPPEIQNKVRELAATTSIPYLKLIAIENYLRTLPYSLDARPGQSYDAVRRLVSSDPRDQVGYAEQHASAFAVLARSQGFPTRVAVGYLLNPNQRRGNTYPVRSGDAHAWAEVNLAGYGWVAFEPTDPAHTLAPAQERRTETGPSGAAPDSPQHGSPPAIAPEPPGHGAETGLLSWLLLPLIVLVVALILVPVVIAGHKLWRRRQRRRGSNAAQIVGAWRETIDRLVASGVAVPRSLTAHEVARRAGQQLGEPAAAVADLAPIVTEAIFCPIPPDNDTVRVAWELDARLSRDLRRALRPLERIRAGLDPRPLITDQRDRRQRRRAGEKA